MFDYRHYIEIKLILERALTFLDEDETYILIHRYGLFDVAKQPARIVADELKIPLHKVYHLERKSLKKVQIIFKKLNINMDLLFG
jgi:DNA-directed RNA polymerase sigma subunit (sigma70/sigma32)